jgi:hypothetical protein
MATNLSLALKLVEFFHNSYNILFKENVFTGKNKFFKLNISKITKKIRIIIHDF